MRCYFLKMSINLSLSQKLKRILQIMAIGILLIYTTIFLYHNIYGYSHNLQDLDVQKDEKESIILKSFNFVNYESLDNTQKPYYQYKTEPSSVVASKYNSVTGTPKPPSTDLDDVFISVKTTKSYHDSRLAMIIKTWFQLAKDQTWFFTDTDDQYYQDLTNGHMINTNCSQGHFRKALCCKMGKELDYFLLSSKKWWCHFDDDNYVNIPRLVHFLSEYSASQDWYLGKPSISSPLEILLDNSKYQFTPPSTSSTTPNPSVPTTTDKNKKISFWFATGGAGFCISRALALKMLPVAGNGKFVAIGDKIRFPDDVTMGFIIEHILNRPMSVVDAFHSHLEQMENIRPETFQDQVSFSYAKMRNEWNVVKIDGGFDLETDPKRFYSLHCHLFPYFTFCPR